MKRRVLPKKDVVSCTYSKKKDPNGAILNDTVGLLLPLDVRGRGRRRFFSPISLLSLSLLNIKKTPTIATCITSDLWPTTGQWKKKETCPSGSRGALHSGRPNHVSPLFSPINIWERTEKRRGWKDRKKEKKKTRRGKKEGRTEKKNKNKKKNREKNRGRQGGRNRQLPPTPPPPGTTTIAGHHWRLRLLQVNPPPLLLSFLPSPCRTCTVHVSAGEVKLVTMLMHSNQLLWAGWAQPMDLGPSPV